LIWLSRSARRLLERGDLRCAVTLATEVAEERRGPIASTPPCGFFG
jgi:hypothetical protein